MSSPDTRHISDVVRLQLLSDGTHTVARTTAYTTGGPLASGKGSAHRDRGDKNDEETGELLATARALESLAAGLRRRARGRIRNAETIKAHRELAAQRREIEAAEAWYERRGTPLPDLSIIAGPPSLLQRIVSSFTGKPHGDGGR